MLADLTYALHHNIQYIVMELYSSQADLRNADLFDYAGRVQYRITSKSGLFSSGKSTITRLVPSRSGQPLPEDIATIEWHSFERNIIRFRGAVMRDEDWIKGSGMMTRWALAGSHSE